MYDATLPLHQYPALVLNADFRPLSYFPLSVWSWQDAIRAICRQSVTVVSDVTSGACTMNEKRPVAPVA